jgi:carboxyl-terminal processing protease
MIKPTLVLVLCLMIFAPLVAASEQTSDDPEARAAPEKLVEVNDLRAFAAVFREVRRSYVEPVDSSELMQAAIRGLLADLDPHSEYLETEQMMALQDDTSGSYAGLGLEVQMLDGMLTVISPIDETPAARAGMRSGDVIVEIDGVPLDVDTTGEAVELLRGEPGSKVQLSVFREGAEPFRVQLTRELINVASVRSRRLADGIGYVRISQFQEDTGPQTVKAIGRLQVVRPLQGLILDLRSNPGGLLTAAVEVSDVFLDAGVIVSTRGRISQTQATLEAGAGDLLAGAPIVVLVDGGTASAAEIVAGALQDHQRALVVGRQTFGKGSVQTILPLENGEALKLTTARYYTPAGRAIQAQGIDPDVVLADAEFKRVAAPERRLSEADLRGHLEAEIEDAKETGSGEDATGAAPAGFEGPGDDYALTEALSIVQALVRWQARTAPSAGGVPGPG